MTEYLMTRLIAAFFTLALTACPGPDDPPGGDAGPTLDAGATGTITWHDDVAPIVFEHCVRCHQAGGIAPFALDSFEQAKIWAFGIKAATQERTMPPFLASNNGDCNTFKHANWLTDAKIATLAGWADTDRLEGSAPSEPPVSPPLPTIETPDAVLDMGMSFATLPEPHDQYRCFIVNAPSATDTNITAYEVVPGEPKVVHHVILYSLESDAAEQQAQALDEDDPAGGYSCYGGSRVQDSRMLAVWAPGTGATTYPEGTGIPVEGGRKMVMQVHYNVDNGALPARTTIKLLTDDTVDNPAIMTIWGNNDLNIPPGVTAHVETAIETNPTPVPVRIWGILPHMHELGVSIRLEKVSADNSETECMIDVAAWDFDWQLSYFLDEPLVVKADDQIRITCTFNSESRTEVTRFGDGTTDEMCLAALYVTR
jgi:hypothetical protein